LISPSTDWDLISMEYDLAVDLIDITTDRRPWDTPGWALK